MEKESNELFVGVPISGTFVEQCVVDDQMIYLMVDTNSAGEFTKIGQVVLFTDQQEKIEKAVLVKKGGKTQDARHPIIAFTNDVYTKLVLTKLLATEDTKAVATYDESNVKNVIAEIKRNREQTALNIESIRANQIEN
ncbi:hypothetical protein EQG49_12480 [Periweissella cryptocerci]|uniref:Uncharacterized protein n=1 Tax=Periweissella cryptocerci TaxID=2506420 RepID=A0A4P6YWQ5_9LACO|nr:hypothetical protein [Periweissella cryptocerci]QBO37213.1 hypothetical protein EQG49_12480 [Periweissella cryptocerci]